MAKDPRKLFIKYNYNPPKLKLIWRRCYHCDWRGTNIRYKNEFGDEFCHKCGHVLNDIIGKKNVVNKVYLQGNKTRG